MNVNLLYDQYSSEDFLCTRTKPRGMLRCGYCDEYYESRTIDTFNDGEVEATRVCDNCGEMSFPYEEA